MTSPARVRLLAAWLLAALVLAGCAVTRPGAASAPAAKPAAPLKLRLGFPTAPAPPLPISVSWLAKDLGFYEAEGLDVELREVEGSPLVVAALQAGELDVGSINAEDVLKLVGRKTFDIKVVNSAGDANFFLVAARDGIGSVRDLSGKSFAVSRSGSFDDVLARQVVANGGGDPTRITFLTVGAPAARAAALVGGRVEATTLSVGTWATIEKEKGVKVLVDADQVNDVVPGVSAVDVASAASRRDKPEALRRYTVALLKASRFFAGNRQAWAEALSRRNGMPVDALLPLWDRFGHGWAVNGGLAPGRMSKTAAFVYQTAPDVAGLPRLAVDDWIDPQFVLTALRELGVDSRMDEPDRQIPK